MPVSALQLFVFRRRKRTAREPQRQQEAIVGDLISVDILALIFLNSPTRCQECSTQLLPRGIYVVDLLRVFRKLKIQIPDSSIDPPLFATHYFD